MLLLQLMLFCSAIFTTALFAGTGSWWCLILTLFFLYCFGRTI